ncbi:hypothetical protein ACFOZY_00680 [Chungangia koreensis]|uniref:Uncharacterized protein n=1 Tax=Chungangia koreensis TaxID=752657 RepID=A0ABV8X1T2_9LACT
MGKWFIWGGAFIAFFFILMGNLFTASSEERFGFYGDEWGLKLPNAMAQEIVLGAQPHPEDNRAKFNVLIYKDSEDFSKVTGLKIITEENLEDLQREILVFQTRAIHDIDYVKENELINLFEENSPDPQIGDSFYYKEDKKGNYFFAIIKENESKVYTFEWSEVLE